MERIQLQSKAEVYYDGENKIYNVKFLLNCDIDIAVAKEIIEKSAMLIQPNEVHANLVDAREMHFLSNEARTLFSRQNNDSLSGVALLVSSVTQRAFANLYLQISRPHIPTVVFTDERLALSWLKQKINEKHSSHDHNSAIFF